MAEHDNSYKLLFSHAEMVADLLRGFVREDWVKLLDFSTLEKRSGSFVSEELRDRHSDVIWRVRWGKDWLYVYILIEFQSVVDPFMAVRMMAYIGLLYQDLIRAKEIQPDGKLPPVMPVVLYNGARPWSAGEEISELIASVRGGLERYQPRVRYLLVDEGRYSASELDSLRNLVAALFRLEKTREAEDIRVVLERLIEWLKAPDQASLRRAFTVWFGRVFIPARAPGKKIPKFQDLQEVRTMLSETIVEWTKTAKEEGRKEALEKLLISQIEVKFGRLNKACRRQITAADSDTLLKWGKRILSMNSLKEVFD